MTTFKTAAANSRTVTRTENGMKTYDTSLNKNVDLFFAIGASRGGDVTALFERAYQENPELATRIALWARDIRGGAGERQIFRDIVSHLETVHPDMVEKVISIVPEIGRWDDLLVLEGTRHEKAAFDMIGAALQAGDGLAAKWLPRKGKTAARLRQHFGWSPKYYRKTLVGLTKVVETQMCAKDWDHIEFSHVPSLAAARYQKAFNRNAPGAYAAYKEALRADDGTAKVNAGAVYPYDVLKPMTGGYGYSDPENPEVIRAQWNALPNYISDELILPMVDVSGSMETWKVAGNDNLTCMDVAVSLGLYLADKNTGDFADMFLTFSERPELLTLGGDIIAKCKQMMRSNWGMNTNLSAAFDHVLNIATKNKLAPEAMPGYVLILSDMEFDSCTRDRSAIKMIKNKFKKAGYEMPNIVFWNLRSAGEKNVPVKFNAEGVALVSGFSPAIMKSILKAEAFTPESIMLETVNVERYNVFG